jgi:2,3-bisphosphoglycerate-independent phosphoglycerate mutase
MKYVIFLIDGMADYPLEELDGKTPLEAADTPFIDGLAKKAEFGTFFSLPEGFPTSSDVANMSVLGWDLAKYYTGRGAIESYGAGIPLDDDMVAFRMNLITVTDKTLEDYSAGHISEPEAEEIIEFLQSKLENEFIKIRKGVSYRHLLYLKGKEYSPDVYYAKPDSSHGLEWEELLPRALNDDARLTAQILRDLIFRSKELLKDHPVNQKRTAEGKNPANLIWPWSGGRKPAMPSFSEMYGKKGAIISAVDVILGIGRLGQMDSVRPLGATGFIDTNYENKALAAVELLRKNDFVYVHIEAADECAHLGDLKNKIRAIEDCDKRLIRVFFDEYSKNFKDGLRVMVLPDHPVPIKLRKHTREMVPFIISGEGVLPDSSIQSYSERNCLRGKYTGLKSRELMDLLFSEKIN